MQPYHYEPLEADEIRLIELRAGESDADLYGRIYKYRLPEDDEPEAGHHVVLTREGGVNVPTAPNYRALSYTWGPDLRPRFHINIVHHDEVYRLGLKPNLYDAIKRLRQDIPTGQTRYFWADAICINQEDMSEKNQQVQKMAMIYNRADNVSVWLGKEDKDSARAISFIERLQRLEDIDELTRDPGTPAEWAALHNLMLRPWFSRRWIVQEIALARDATLYCGPNSVSWADFATATALFAARHKELRPLFQSSRDFDNHPDYLGEVEALGARSLVDITANLFRKTDDGVVLERLFSLEALISTLTLFEAGSPHDTIYAVLWLAHDAEPRSRESAAMSMEPLVRTPTQSPELDMEASQYHSQHVGTYSQRIYDELVQSPRPMSPGASQVDYFEPSQRHIKWESHLKPPSRDFPANKPRRSASDLHKMTAESDLNKLMGLQLQPHSIVVDYKADVYEVFKQFLTYAISRSRSLDIICYPWAPELLRETLPSWIPQLSGAPFEREPGSNAYSRVRADPLVGRPGLGVKHYNASGKTKMYPPRDFIQDRTLITTGFTLDAIRTVSTPASDGVIPSAWLDLVNWSGPPERVPERWWRTLVADRAPGGESYPPAYYPLACRWVFEQRSRRGNINTNKLLTHGRCPSIATEFLRRVQAVIWDRKLVLTEGRKGSKQLLALVPKEAEVGDIICILYGCSVPVVLRRQRKRKAAANDDRSAGAPRTESTASVSTVGDRMSVVPPQISLSRASSAAAASDIESAQPTTEAKGLFIKPPLPGAVQPNSGARRRLDDGERDTPESGNTVLPLSLESPYQYTLIGECYVHGMMAGEGFKHQKDHGNKARAFHIV